MQAGAAIERSGRVAERFVKETARASGLGDGMVFHLLHCHFIALVGPECHAVGTTGVERYTWTRRRSESYGVAGRGMLWKENGSACGK